MPKLRKLATFTFERGYFPNQPIVGEPNGTLYAGEGVWVRGHGKTESWKGVERIGSAIVQNVVQNVDDVRAYLSSGSIIRYPGGALFCISPESSAEVLLNEVSAFNLSSTAGELTVALPDGLGGYDAIPAGLPTPTLTTVTAVAGGTKDMEGVYSVRIARRRSQDSAYSGWSNAVTVTVAAGERIEVTFPAADGASEQDQWMVAATRKGLGTTGPWYEVPDASELTETDVAAAGRTLEVEWRDLELQTLIQTDVAAASVGRFLFLLDNVLHVVTSAGGNTPDSRIEPMLPLNPTRRLRRAATSTQNGHTIVGVIGGQGIAFLMCKQSLQVATPTGQETRPTTTRQVWDFGFYNEHAGVVIDGTFYGWTAKGLARTAGDQEPERTFTQPVDSLLRTFDRENIVLGNDPVNVALVVFHANDDDTTTAVPFMHREGVWSSPMTIPGLVKSAAVVDGQLVIVVYEDSEYHAYYWDQGDNIPLGWYAVSPFCDAGNEVLDKQLMAANVTASANHAGLHIVKRGEAKPSLSVAPTGARMWSLDSGDTVHPTKHLNISNVALFAAYVSGDDSAQTVDEFVVSGIPVEVIR